MNFLKDINIGAESMGRWKGLIEEEDWEEDKDDDEEDEDEEWWNTTTNKNRYFQSFLVSHSKSNVTYSRDFGYGFQKKYCFQQYAVIRLQIWLEVWSLL